MGDRTEIQWTDATWNPVRGCSRVSEGCRNCYAEKVARRFSGPGEPYEGLVELGAKGARWNGQVRLVQGHLGDPLRWRRPRRVFVNSMSDLFHEAIPFEYIAACFGVMAASPGHTFQVLTKRPERAAKFFGWLDREAGTCIGGHVTACVISAQRASGHELLVPATKVRSHAWPLPNVWLGVSCEDQRAADERVPVLLDLPAAVRFISAEPLLGPIDFRRLRDDELGAKWDALEAGIGWVIVGGESGPGARPCDVAWVRSIVEQCRGAGVACFVKQLGARPRGDWGSGRLPIVNHEIMRVGEFVLRDHKGGDPSEWPADLRVQDFPGGA